MRAMPLSQATRDVDEKETYVYERDLIGAWLLGPERIRLFKGHNMSHLIQVAMGN